jgi:hypothetical protein
MSAYGDHRSPRYYEYDHFVPLELGGATNDRRNLWPEPGVSPNPKDAVEDELNRKVCDGVMTLASAQRAIVANWVSLASKGAQQPHHGAPTPSSPAARCSATADYSGTHHDYDVYVESNQPDRLVAVTGSGGQTASYYTNSSGYADVYFYARRSASGEEVTVRVGEANCPTTL